MKMQFNDWNWIWFCMSSNVTSLCGFQPRSKRPAYLSTFFVWNNSRGDACIYNKNHANKREKIERERAQKCPIVYDTLEVCDEIWNSYRIKLSCNIFHTFFSLSLITWYDNNNKNRMKYKVSFSPYLLYMILFSQTQFFNLEQISQLDEDRNHQSLKCLTRFRRCIVA